jgi:hypothetical protein
MNSINLDADREDKAIAALIAAVLHQDETPVDPLIVAKYLRGEFKLAEEEESALKHARIDFGVAYEQPQFCVAEEAPAFEVPALHRQKPTTGFSKHTEEELERKRRELQEKLRQRRQRPPQ